MRYNYYKKSFPLIKRDVLLFISSLLKKLKMKLIKFLIRYWKVININQYQEILNIQSNNFPEGKKNAKMLSVIFNFNEDKVYNDWNLVTIKFFTNLCYFLLFQPENFSSRENKINFDNIKYEEYIVAEQLLINGDFKGLIEHLNDKEDMGKEKVVKHLDTLWKYVEWSVDIKEKYTKIYPKQDKVEKNEIKKVIDKDIISKYYQLMYNISDGNHENIKQSMKDTVKSFYNFATMKITFNEKEYRKLKRKKLL